jgi:2-polyprenyl-3-methyl-5-hydroxy-6-metoxy-1,4-benzoquinol methylase
MRNHTKPSDESLLVQALTKRFLKSSAIDREEPLTKDRIGEDLKSYIETHARLRLDKARFEVVPWLAHFGSLRGKTILELGCGTGASTVALAEQGAIITATDVDDTALDVTR